MREWRGPRGARIPGAMNNRQNTMERGDRQDTEDALIAEALRFLVKLQIDTLPQELIAEREKLIRSIGLCNSNIEWGGNQGLKAPTGSYEPSEEDDDTENLYHSLFTDENDKTPIMTHTDIASLCGGPITTAEVLNSKAELAGWLWREQRFHRKHRYWVLIYKDTMFLYLNSKGRELEKIQLHGCSLKKYRKGTSFILSVPDKAKGTSQDHKFHTSSTELAQKWTQQLISTFAIQQPKPPEQLHLRRAPSLPAQEGCPTSTCVKPCFKSKCALIYHCTKENISYIAQVLREKTQRLPQCVSLCHFLNS